MRQEHRHGDPDSLVRRLSSESSDERKEAAAALARLPQTPASFTALTRALADTAPKVRKSAAIALARPGNSAALRPLLDALEREEHDWVRASLILAVGRIGGPDAAAALSSRTVESDVERDALAKAQDRLRERFDAVKWRAGYSFGDVVHAASPSGVEDIAAGEAKESIAAEIAGEGLLHFASGTSPAGLLSRMRCIEDVRLLVATGPPLEEVPPARMPELVRSLLRGAKLLESWRDWLVSDADVLRYRFSLDNVRIPQSAFRSVLATVRDVLRELGMVDSASSYSALLRVDSSKSGTRVWFVPAFEKDERFAYRVADVGAAINPVVGASLARLVRSHERGTVVDPTCGSGTLLVERALLDADVSLHGIDISPTAIAAATQNIAAANLQSRTQLKKGDAGDRAVWPPSCVEVIANLPFGVRSARMDRDLAAVYSGIVRLTQELLVAGGRALFYTSNRRLMDAELRKASRLKRAGERTIASGGIDVHAWLVTKA